MDTFNKLNLAQKEQGNMEPLERQAFYDEQDDYWLVMEMYQAYIEWMRFQRYGKIEEDELEEDTVKDEVADQVLKLDMS